MSKMLRTSQPTTFVPSYWHNEPSRIGDWVINTTPEKMCNSKWSSPVKANVPKTHTYPSIMMHETALCDVQINAVQIDSVE
jgi:hypothetical protein